ncbi:MAG: hypothetical protein F9K44_04745 [Hyphomicrobiaceae bacterium]|nr:MAG: hypothetical protein F9K44_04745 [Hyphomicrobiaceae bacterium]
MVRKLAIALSLAAGLGVATQASAGYKFHHSYHHKSFFVWKDVCYWKSFYHYGEYKKVWFCHKVLVKVHH